MMFLAHQMILLGSGSLYTRPIYVSLLLLVLLLCGVAVGLFVITLRHGVKSHDTRPRVNRTPTILPPLHQTKAGRIGKTLGLIVFGMALGWMWKAHQDRTIYIQEHEAWKQRSADYQRAYAAWSARQPKKENR